MINIFEEGTFGYDLEFFKDQHIEAIELKDDSSRASVLVIPAYQGRVMTSSADGPDGKSFGWINYDCIRSGEINKQFNPFGGEERFWLGPEGGPFSIYFDEGKEQSFANWRVPAEIDTLAFDVSNRAATQCSFRKEFEILNASGTGLNIGMEWTVVFIPYNEDAGTNAGKVVEDDYFGKVPSDRLIVKNGTLL